MHPLQKYNLIEIQQQSMWCWASCIQSALSQAGISKSQSDIVETLLGWQANAPANSQDIIWVLHSYNFRAWMVPYPANPQQLYDVLADGWKLIAFVNPNQNPMMGHYIMLQGISPQGFIIVSDPANGGSYEQNIDQLYYGWSWTASVVVGTPVE